MVSLSVGHFGALRYRYNDMKALDNRIADPVDGLSPAGDTRYQIYTPWIVGAGAPGYELNAVDRLNSQFLLPMMRRDVHKQHQYDIGWKTNIYDPLDQRTKSVPSKPRAFAPIPCPTAEASGTMVPSTNVLYTSRNPPNKYGTVMALQDPPFVSTPSTRSEEWSTLRQMLPSKGPVVLKKPADNWGTGIDSPPKLASDHGEAFRVTQQPNFPRINSAMSRYAHESYFHDNLFKMF